MTFAAIVDGIVEAIARAHADLAPADLRLAHGELHDASINRSRSSFELEPAADRAHFPDAIDPLTTLLRIERDGRLVGAVNWFATHGTSMTNTNRLISSDNKGYAAYHWERLVDRRRLPRATSRRTSSPPSRRPTPATCRPTSTSPRAAGPTEDEFENTRLIGLRQYERPRRAGRGGRRAARAGRSTPG